MFYEMYVASQKYKSDIVICNYKREFENYHVDCQFDKASTPQLALSECWGKNVIPLGLPFLIVKKEFLKFAFQNVINTSYGEDNFIIRYVFAKAKTIYYLDSHYYHYDRRNANSLMNNMKFSRSEWKTQKENLRRISKYLYNLPNGKRPYHITVNKWKYDRKQLFSSVFKNIYEFYYEFDECYDDINEFLFTPKGQRLKTYLVYNLFPLFWLYFRNNWKQLK